VGGSIQVFGVGQMKQLIDEINVLSRMLEDGFYVSVPYFLSFPWDTPESISRRLARRYIKTHYPGMVSAGREMHVHHVDHNPMNNSPENLFVVKNSTHIRYHAKMRRDAKQLPAGNGKGEWKMKLRIIDRKNLISEFNRMNCTTSTLSRYAGARVDGMCIVFKHTNGVGTFRIAFDYNHSDGIFTREIGFDGIEKNLTVY
jgi:hypothetical protein